MDVGMEPYARNVGFAQILDRAAERYPHCMAIIHDEKRVSYSALHQRVNRLANALDGRAVALGDCVAIASKNCIEYLEVEFALYKLGATAVKINWRMTPEEITYLLRVTRSKMLFLDPEIAAAGDRLEKLIPDIKIVRFPHAGQTGGEYESLVASGSNLFSARIISEDTPAFVVHTSGTTGTPKCVRFTHGDLLAKERMSLSVMPFEHSTVFLMIEQLFHIACMRAYMCVGSACTLVLVSHFSPENYLSTIQREQVTSLGMIPAVLKRTLDNPNLGEYNISSLKYINYSTCAMPQPLVQNAINRLHCAFYQVYGMTEMLGLVTILTPEDHLSSEHLRSVGKAAPGYEIKAVRENGTQCNPGERGELFIRGPVMMRGYLDQPALSADALAGGWYHSKDLGFVDEDEYVYVCGRKDDMIVSGGENIYPQEILSVLEDMENDIVEAAVYGIPDPVWGEKVWASVALNPESSLSQEDILMFCRERLANYKVPKGVELLKELPKNTTGKILIRELAKEAEKRQA